MIVDIPKIRSLIAENISEITIDKTVVKLNKDVNNNIIITIVNKKLVKPSIETVLKSAMNNKKAKFLVEVMNGEVIVTNYDGNFKPISFNKTNSTLVNMISVKKVVNFDTSVTKGDKDYIAVKDILFPQVVNENIVDYNTMTSKEKWADSE